MYDGFKERAAAVRALLSEPGVGFVLVTSPSPVAVDETLAFHDRLHAESMPIAGLVANRVTPDLWPGGPLPDADALSRALGVAGVAVPGLAERLARTFAEHQALATADHRSLERLLTVLEAPTAIVPRMETDVHDLAGLAGVWERL
jgi:anion-transporting  ArsA/GET3 family ATPase